MQTAREDLGYLGCPDMGLPGLPLGWALSTPDRPFFLVWAGL